jgi:hypothetical protein
VGVPLLKYWETEILGNRGNKLGRRERLRQHNAVRNTLGCPILRTFPAYINHAKFGINLFGLADDFPTVDLVAAQIYAGGERPILPPAPSRNSMACPSRAKARCQHS